MSFIRFGQERTWTECESMYVYPAKRGNSEALVGLPDEKHAFAEIAMQMLEQSGELSEEELDAAFAGFVSRLRLDEDRLKREVDL